MQLLTPRASFAQEGHTGGTPHCHRGVTSSSPLLPKLAMGTSPHPSCCCRDWGGSAPPGVSVAGPVQMAEPGSSCPHGGDGANVTPATWHRGLALALAPPMAPPAKQQLPGGPRAGSTPRAPGGAKRMGDPSISGVLMRVTGMEGHRRGEGGHTQHPPFTLALPRPRRRLKCPPRASRSGYRLHLQLPFIAPVPVPVPSPAPTTPPAGDSGIRAPQDTPRHQGVDPLQHWLWGW